MNVLALFDTLGLIFGPIMLLSAMFALALCLRASMRTDSPQSRRTALFGSLLPLGVGVCAAVFGACFILVQTGGVGGVVWPALGKCILAGLVVTLVPLLWTLFLPRPQRTIA
jgi:hypothetical protein